MKARTCQLFAITLMAGSQCVSGQDPRSERNIVSEGNWRQFLRYVEPVLKSAGGAGRLYYRADCWTSGGDGILFPPLQLEAPAESKTGLAALKDIFRKEKGVTIAGGRSGISRISIGNVGYELLNTKIQVLTFTPSQRYNTEEAIVAIERTKEVQAKMRELGLQEPPTVYFGRVLEPASGLPHLPASMKNVTMDEALDGLAQTFGGLVTYGECESADGKHLFSVDFLYIK